MAGRILHGPKLRCGITETCLGQFFYRMSEKHGDKICQIAADTGETETFNSCRLRSTRVALHMRNKFGIGPKDVILICSKNSLDSVIPLLASTYLGAIAATLDPSLSVRDTKHLIFLIKPKLIFVEEDAVPLIENSLEGDHTLETNLVVFGGSHGKYLSFGEFLKSNESEERKFEPVSVETNETALIFFSSGTTGLPKAICLTHKYFLNTVGVFTNVICDALLHFTSLYWVTGAYMLVLSFAKGGYRVLMPQFDAKLTFQVIEKYRVTFILMAPTLTYSLVNLETAKDYDTSSVQMIGLAGSNISDAQMAKLRALFRHTQVQKVYGSTEVGFGTLFDVVEDKDLIASKPRSCGKAAPGNTIKVVDPETNEILGPNQPGEIRIKNDHLTTGYYNMEMSADCFDQDGFFKTGDVGFYDTEECIYIVDRIREMFKYQSWHIMPSIIEGVLLEQPQISEAVVFGLPHEEYGDIPAAMVVLKRDATDEDGSKNATEEEIAEFVAKRVSDREKLRGGVFIVDCIPKTPSGKVIRNKVRDDVINLLGTSNK